MKDTPLPSIPNPGGNLVWQFSIRNLMILTLLVGIACVIGSLSLWLLALALFLGFLIVAGVSAHRSSRIAGFIYAMSAMFLLFLLPGVSVGPRGLMSDFDVIVLASMVGTGLFLSSKSIYSGHWSTKLLGSIVLIPYVLIVTQTVETLF